MIVKNEKTEQCFCQSYYDDDNVLQDCTCGKCEIDEAMKIDPDFQQGFKEAREGKGKPLKDIKGI